MLFEIRYLYVICKNMISVKICYLYYEDFKSYGG